MARCTAIAQSTGARCRNRATPGGDRCRRHRGEPQQTERPADLGLQDAEEGLYDDCFDAADRSALASALASGLDEETALMRVLIRRALIEGRPATQVAYLVGVLAQIVKTQHVLAGKSAKQLDEALAAALDAIAAEMGVKL